MASDSDRSTPLSSITEKPNEQTIAAADKFHSMLLESGMSTTAVFAQEPSEFRVCSLDAAAQSVSSTTMGLPDTEPKYAIERYEDKDDAGYVTSWRWRVHRLLPLTTLAAVGGYFLYFALRIRYTVESQRASRSVFPMAWIFVFVEAGVACESLATLYVPPSLIQV